MELRAHPTHHANFKQGRLLWGVVAGIGGVFFCVFVAMIDPGASAVLRFVRTTALALGGLAFVGGTGVALVTDVGHRFARCTSCGRRIFRTRIDYRQSYYPCRRCGVR